MFLTKDNLWCATLAHKLARTTVVGLLGLAFACWGLSGCSEDDSVTESVTPEVVEVTDRYVGERIYFKIGEDFHTGYVVKGVSENEVLVLLDEDRSEMTVDVDRIGGTEIADHPDTEEKQPFYTFIPWGDSKTGVRIAGGYIKGVYSDGTRKISIRFRSGYQARDGKWADREDLFNIPKADRPVVFRSKKLTKGEWTVLVLDEKWEELMEGYITKEAYNDWVLRNW